MYLNCPQFFSQNYLRIKVENLCIVRANYVCHMGTYVYGASFGGHWHQVGTKYYEACFFFFSGPPKVPRKACFTELVCLVFTKEII
jgi:hypothetical protein